MGRGLFISAILRTLPAFVTILLLSSCLEPSGSNYVDLPQPDLASYSVDLADIGSDTIYIGGPTSFTYSVNGTPIVITAVDVKLDDRPVYTSQSSGSTFTVSPGDFENGFHLMTVTVTGHPGNESLADRLGLEVFQVSDQFNTITDRDPPEAAKIIKVDSSSGVLKIYWNKYSRRNFVSYRIIRLCEDHQVCFDTLITTANDTSWIDHGYVAGQATYQVNIQNGNKTTQGIEFPFSWSPAFVVDIEGGYATLHWSQPLFYKSLKEMTLEDWLDPFDVHAVTDTTFHQPEKISFGAPYAITVTFVSDDQTRTVAFKKYYYVGTEYEPPTVMPRAYNSKENLYYGTLYGGTGTTVMDADLTPLFNGNLTSRSISPNGEYFISLEGNSFYKTDPETLDESFLLATGYTSVNNFIAADNGLIGFNSKSGYRVMDLQTGEEKFAEDPSITPVTRLSPSGNYIVSYSRKLYHYDGSAFQYEGDLPATFNPINPFAFQGDENLIASDGSLQIFNLSTLLLTSTPSDGTGYISSLTYDPVSKKVLFLQTTYKLFDPSDNEITAVAPFQVNIMRLLNGKLFSLDLYSVLTCDVTSVQP